jgi:hypothetical protein
MAESISLKPCETNLSKWPPNGHRQQKIEEGFWPTTGIGENVPSWALCAGIHPRSTDPALADARHARLRHKSRLDKRGANQRGRSGAAERELREKLLAAGRRREIDVVLVWQLDRWGRSLVDLVVTLKELAELGVGFVSFTEALDLTIPTGGAMAGLLSVFAEFEHEILRERIRTGIAEARSQGKHLGRTMTAGKDRPDPRSLPGRSEQSRDRTPPRYRPQLPAPDTVSKAAMEKQAKDSGPRGPN